MPTAIFDTHAGLLQWLSHKESVEKAVAEFLRALNSHQDEAFELYVIVLTAIEAEALTAWANAGSYAADYPEDVPEGRIFRCEELSP